MWRHGNCELLQDVQVLIIFLELLHLKWSHLKLLLRYCCATVSHEEVITTLNEKDKYEKMKDNLRNENEKYEIMRLISGIKHLYY